MEGLTRRERQVLERVAQGKDNGEIADEMGRALNTVRRHVTSIYEKLHVRSRSQAVAKYTYIPNSTA